MDTQITIPNFIDNGTVDWGQVKKAYGEIVAIFKAHRDEINVLTAQANEINTQGNEINILARRLTFSVSGMFEIEGRHTLISGGAHVRCKLISAHAVMHDNKKNDIRLKLTGLTEEIKFSETELKGCGKIFTVLPNANKHFIDPIEIEITASRRVSVYATFESAESTEGVP